MLDHESLIMPRVRTSLVSKQPGKAIWALAATTFTTLQLPFWLIAFIARRYRQHPQWTYRQALMNKLIRAILYHSSFVEVCTPVRLDENDRFVTFPPADDRVYRGLLNDSKIRPSITGGTWYPSVYESGDDQHVVLHFHGGAYVTGEGRPGDIAFSATTLVKFLSAKALLLSYRLSSNKDCHFPAALQDAVTAYQYLLDQGIPASRIVVSGDSAGASLAVSLLRHIANSEGVLPAPSAALLFSPWLDLKSARDSSLLSRNRNYNTDYVPGNFTAWGANTYIPDGMNADDPYFSLLDHPFLTTTPLWVQVGALEILYDEGVKFVDAMRKKGNTVEVHVEPLANHDILYVGNLTGFVAEAERSVKLAKEFLDSKTQHHV